MLKDPYNQLYSLDISGFGLSGSIPTDLFDSTNGLVDLETLNLSNNISLVSTIPSEIGGLLSLQNLQLFNTGISGMIPTEIGGLLSLQNLQLYNTGISGMIPTEIGSLVFMMYFYLDNSDIGGTIPTEIGSMTSLVTFDLSHNSVSGTIPAALFTVSTIQEINLSNNFFTGTIPNIYGPSLTKVQAHSNLFTGVVTCGVSDMSADCSEGEITCNCKFNDTT